MSWKSATCLCSVTPSVQGKFLPREKNKDFYSGNTVLWSDDNKIKHLANMQHAMFGRKQTLHFAPNIQHSQSNTWQ